MITVLIKPYRLDNIPVAPMKSAETTLMHSIFPTYARLIFLPIALLSGGGMGVVS